jgi:hypothetical protein
VNAGFYQIGNERINTPIERASDFVLYREHILKFAIYTIASIYITAFLLHFVWEMWQVPFYTDMVNADHWQALLQCTKASLGDGVITLLAYLLAIVVSGRGRLGQFKNRITGWSVFLGAGLIITIGLELVATKYLDRWQYSELMPIVPYLDVGLVPLTQWLVLPPLTLWVSWIFVRGLRFEIDRSALERTISDTGN